MDHNKSSIEKSSNLCLNRNCEFIEKLLVHLERKNLFQSVSISVKIESAQDITPVLAFTSLRELVLKYPIFFMFPEGSGRGMRWEPLEKISFSDVFEINEEVDICFLQDNAKTKVLNELSISEHHKTKRPLWKIVYFSKTRWLSFFCAHSFTDGGSVLVYLKELVKNLNHGQSLKRSQNSPILFDFKNDAKLLKHGICPTLFDCIEYNPDLATRLTAFAFRTAVRFFPVIVPTAFETQMHNECFVDKQPIPFNSSAFFESEYMINEASPLNNVNPLFINIPSLQLAEILLSCKIHGVKLQTYVIIAYIHTIHQMYPDLYASKSLKISIAVSFRNIFTFLQSHNTYTGATGRFDDGFYTFIVKYFLEPNTVFSWEVVSKYHDFLHATINSPEWLKSYYVAQGLTAESYMNPRIDKKKDDIFLSATNLGLIDFEEHTDPEKFRIKDVLFAPSSGAPLGTHHVTMCSTSWSGLNIGISDGDRNIKNWRLFTSRFRENMISLHSEE